MVVLPVGEESGMAQVGSGKRFVGMWFVDDFEM